MAPAVSSGKVLSSFRGYYSPRADRVGRNPDQAQPGRPGPLRPPPDLQRPHRSGQRASGTPTRHRPGPAHPHPHHTPDTAPDSNHPDPTTSPTYHTLRHEEPLKSPLLKTLRQVAMRQSRLAVVLGTPERLLSATHSSLSQRKSPKCASLRDVGDVVAPG